MLLIRCPHCGPRAQEEFVYERSTDAIVRFDDAPAAAIAALYQRENPRGWADELWWHAYGCRGWLVVRRHRITHAMERVRAVGAEAPA